MHNKKYKGSSGKRKSFLVFPSLQGWVRGEVDRIQALKDRGGGRGGGERP